MRKRLCYDFNMNRLPLKERARVIGCLCEGMSVRATSRLTGVAKGTILRLLESVGAACDLYQSETLRDLQCRRVQCDEVWGFCGAKERNLKPERRGTLDLGDVWTWVAIDSDTKLIVTWLMGKRTRDEAFQFVGDLAARISSENVQITTDGFGAYVEPIERLFPRADYGTEVKVYGRMPFESADSKYSPMVVTDVVRTPKWGAPDEKHITTAHVERNNLTMRMQMRRLTRLTNAFSKKAKNMSYAMAMHFMYYNFVRKHGTVGTTPAMAAGVTDRYWTYEDLANLPELMTGEAVVA
jgi:IS1 family transposase